MRNGEVVPAPLLAAVAVTLICPPAVPLLGPVKLVTTRSGSTATDITDTVTLAELPTPTALRPVTEYVVESEGETTPVEAVLPKPVLVQV